MTFARWTFRLAGIFGLLALAPQYFMESQLAREFPPPLAHPVFFYGFTGVALAWQVAFLIIAQDPRRYRPLMIAAMIEKFSFGIAAGALYFQQRIETPFLAAAMFDVLLGLLFVEAYRRSGRDLS